MSERSALREAISTHKAALEQVASAKATLQKGNDLVAALSKELAEFQDLDNEVALARSANLKLALATGEQHFNIAEPSGFASRIIARDNAMERLASVQMALPTLEREVADAEAEATNCDFAIERAAEKVLAVETELRAVAHLEKITALRKEHYIISQLAMRYVKHPPSFNSAGQLGTISQRRAQMSGVTISAAMENVLGDYELRGGMKVRNEMGLAAQAYWQALKTNADAEFAEFEPQDDAPKQAAE